MNHENEDMRVKPVVSLARAEQLAADHYGLVGTAESLPSERDLNFRIVESGSEQIPFLLKVANPATPIEILELENQAIQLATAGGFSQLKIFRNTDRRFLTPFADENANQCTARLLSYVPGRLLADCNHLDETTLVGIGAALAKLDQALLPLEQNQDARRTFRWNLPEAPFWIKKAIGNQNQAACFSDSQVAILERILEQHEQISGRWNRLPHSVIQNDPNDYNILLDGDCVTFIDFGDLVYSQTINNLAICCAYVGMRPGDPVELMSTVIAGYDQIRTVDETEMSVLFPLILLRLGQSVSIAQIQQQLDPENEYLSISTQPAWELLNQLIQSEPERVRMQFVDRCLQLIAHQEASPDTDKLLERRQKSLGPSLSLSYDQPLHIVKGQGQYLYDQQGRKFLDCVNNVCHVGHCHPRVVDAAVQQMGVLNTNTRYLHENILQYAERLTETLPEGLEVCYFVNSGSEANDLALRIAKCYTGNQDVAVLDHAYHGHTERLIEISPYKFNSKGGKGQSEDVHVFPTPDTYRGMLRDGDLGSSEQAGVEYTRLAEQVLQKASNQRGGPVRLAAFFAESLMGCGGQLPLPDGYLESTYQLVRDQGAVCIADEVQVGFGRVGSHFWGFESQGVVPDIVTMGKPIGNGHPLAAVVTRREIAYAFANGMEYFNTFGGNPVSCAVGLAVLDVLKTEGLQEHARDTGNWLLAQFRELQQKFPVVGDVRGSGFFLGLELVANRETREPATELANELVQQLRGSHILLSTDGPFNNVIKFKPPMVFDQADAERLAMSLDRHLQKLNPIAS